MGRRVGTRHRIVGVCVLTAAVVFVASAPATAPIITVPGDLTREAASPAGAAVTFDVSSSDPAAQPTCDHASGDTFPLGATTVTCAATNADGETGTASFIVTVQDTAAPSVNAPGDATVEATSGAGASYSFSASASDNIDGSLTPTCSPASGATFALGNTAVTCSATDAHQNTGSATFHVIVQDTTVPTVTVPGDATVNATASAGASYTFSASATDTVDGSLAPSCSPASGATFPLGSTTVTCSATDAHHNTSSATFHVAVHDTTPPEVTVPAKTVIEASGPQGAPGTFTATATDKVDGPIAPPAVHCMPASGSTFPLGTTKVTCTAADSQGNTGQGAFDLVVQDKTPPRLNVPGSTTLPSPDGSALSSTNPGVAAVLASARANDLVDGAVAVANNAPASFPIGTTTVVFTARDAAGNSVSSAATITVSFTPGAPPPPPDTIPPANPGRITVAASSGRVAISWQAPTAPDLDHYSIEQQANATGPAVVVYSGTATSFTASGLTNGTQYRFVIVAVDRAGNQSTGVAVIATPALPALVKPRDGAVVTAPPQLAWLAVGGAPYYNVQLYLMPSVAAVGGRKVLSTWPTTTSLQLTATWRFGSAQYRLIPGVYRWYVWPGSGERVNGNYGPLLGTSSFVVRAGSASVPKKQPAKKPAKKPSKGKR